VLGAIEHGEHGFGVAHLPAGTFFGEFGEFLGVTLLIGSRRDRDGGERPVSCELLLSKRARTSSPKSFSILFGGFHGVGADRIGVAAQPMAKRGDDAGLALFRWWPGEAGVVGRRWRSCWGRAWYCDRRSREDGVSFPVSSSTRRTGTQRSAGARGLTPRITPVGVNSRRFMTRLATPVDQESLAGVHFLERLRGDFDKLVHHPVGVFDSFRRRVGDRQILSRGPRLEDGAGVIVGEV